MQIRMAKEWDLPELLEIYNYEVVNDVATLDLARKDDSIHTVVSVITSGNEASTRLHEKFDFEFCGTIQEVGMKFGRYLDIDNYRLGVEREAKK